MATLLLEQEAGLTKGRTLNLRAGCVVESKCSLGLEEFVKAQKAICAAKHDKYCTRCLVLLRACSKIMIDGMCTLGILWRHTTSKIKYKSDKAKTTFLRTPLAFISCYGRARQVMVIRTMLKHMN